MDARNRKSKEPRITDVPPDTAPENTDKIELIWSLYRSLTPNLKICAIDGLLKHSNFEQLCHIFNSVPIFTKVDFVSKLPLEISIKVLFALINTDIAVFGREIAVQGRPGVQKMESYCR